MQLQALPQFSCGWPTALQVAEHAFGPQVTLLASQACAALQSMEQVPVPQIKVVSWQLWVALHSSWQA